MALPRYYHSTVTRKGQATIPVELREQLGFKEGDRVVWWEEDGKLVGISAQEYVRRMAAVFKSNRAPSSPSLTIQEIKEAAAKGWVARDEKWRSQQ